MITIDNFNRNKLYWIFQITGWLLFYTTYVIIEGTFSGFTGYIFASYFNTVVVGIFLTHVYRLYIKRHDWVSLGIFKLALRVAAASLIIGVLWSLIILPINQVLFEDAIRQKLTWLVGFIVTFNLTVMVLAWSLIYFLVQIFTNFRRSEIEKWQLEAAVKDAELIALKSQINPHFIFNSLNNIRSLVIENPEKSRDMITHLSGLLRYSIQFNNMERVSLESELEIVQNYLNLESIQFEDRLQYTLEIKPETLELQIPPMAVQLLVENAIKHGISHLPEGGEIRIKSYLKDEALVVEVINTGQLKDKSDGTGIGIKNASDRLKLLFGKLSTLQIQNMNEKFVCAKFSIPLNS